MRVSQIGVEHKSRNGRCRLDDRGLFRMIGSGQLRPVAEQVGWTGDCDFERCDRAGRMSDHANLVRIDFVVSCVRPYPSYGRTRIGASGLEPVIPFGGLKLAC